MLRRLSELQTEIQLPLTAPHLSHRHRVLYVCFVSSGEEGKGKHLTEDLMCKDFSVVCYLECGVSVISHYQGQFLGCQVMKNPCGLCLAFLFGNNAVIDTVNPWIMLSKLLKMNCGPDPLQPFSRRCSCSYSLTALIITMVSTEL